MPGAGLLASVALGCVVVLVSFAVWGQATRKVQVAGVLLPPGGVQQLVSPQAGRLIELHVREGQTVRPGDVLAVVDVSVHSDLGNTAVLVAQSLEARRAALDQETRALAQQAQQREHALRDRLRSVQLDITQAEGELEAAQGRQALAQHGLERDQLLAAQGFLSSAQVQVRQGELLEHQARQRQARRNLEALRREAQGLAAEADAVRLQATADKAQLERARAGMVQEGTELAARKFLHLTAPVAARVGAINMQPGHSSQAGQTILSLLPVQAGHCQEPLAPVPAAAAPKAACAAAEAPLHAQLYAPSRAAGFVAAGQPVWMRLQAFPYQKFGMLPGKVLSVSHSPVQPQDLPAGMAQALLAAAQSQEPLYRIDVALLPYKVVALHQTALLKPGMVLEANVVQDRRAIWEWVLEPIFSARVRFTAFQSFEPT